MIKKVRIVLGRVINNRMQNSAVVAVEKLVKHKKYGKFVKHTTKLHVHDSNNEANIGDIIAVKECRPISKTKSWILTSIIKKSNFIV
ncbi:30S ribosomal protein S17 [Candidatus Blochmannia ocreatus (nom. nud.)]|uniref:Small ribosomal subunit protein uS17 n=1 Tax=Candidatus Blochmannia ocreatus (nom. nud.) TaxID=251538 RepID=A0ABY4STH9_9ENTR|nr:30S ribosomal protein S17 [Candidatus Blochmannia ocreatus]URJ25277.1 30S ribosomal protein S17 [Candidatus Blochmannia ocreatus]